MVQKMQKSKKLWQRVRYFLFSLAAQRPAISFMRACRLLPALTTLHDLNEQRMHTFMVSRTNRTRFLLYGCGVLALFNIHRWNNQKGDDEISLREGMPSFSASTNLPPHSRARLTFGFQEEKNAETLLNTDAFDSHAPRDCCGEVSASCRPILASNHLLVFVSIPNVASATERRFPLRKQWHKSLSLMHKKINEASPSSSSPSSSSSSSSSNVNRSEHFPALHPARTALRFVIGTQNMEQAQLQSIRQEAAFKNDILMIDAPDRDEGEPKRGSSTTLKVMHSMRYAANNFVFEYFARVGDDAYFRVDYFAELVLLHETYPRDNAYIGHKFANHVVPASESTHNFIVGMGFFLTRDLTTYVCRSYPYLLDGFPEDAIVGSWFVGTNAQVIHEPRFHDIDHVTTVAYARCSNESLLMHHMWHQENWDSIDEEGLLEC
jgi:hypothetical protein